MAARDYGQFDGVTRGLELVGERWALLIVRDLLVGPRRYGELAAGLPRIPSNILAARLKELQAAGVIRRAPRSRIIIYELTPYGRELEPIVLALSAAVGDTPCAARKRVLRSRVSTSCTVATNCCDGWRLAHSRTSGLCPKLSGTRRT